METISLFLVWILRSLSVTDKMNTSEEEIVRCISSRIGDIQSLMGHMEWRSRLGEFYHPIRVVSSELSSLQIDMLNQYYDREVCDYINLFIEVFTFVNKTRKTVEIVVRIDPDVNPEEWSNNYIVGAVIQEYPLIALC